MFAKFAFAATAAAGLFAASPASAQPADILSELPELTHKAPDHIANDPANTLTLTLDNGGTIDIQLRPDAAPLAVHRIQTLASQGFYDGTVFHRVIPGFMAQGGDPLGTGLGGSTLPDLKAEFNRLPHLRGVFAMARSQAADSANSQFYIVLNPSFVLDKSYTVLGRVKAGMQAVDTIAPGEPPANPTVLASARIGGPVPAAPMTVAPEAQAAQ